MNKIYHYCGHIITNDGSGRFPLSKQMPVQKHINNYFQNKQIDSCYGSLASGADIMIANTMMGSDVDLHVVLPFCRDEFLKKSVLPAGNQWFQSFTQLINYASSMTQVYFGELVDENKSYALCSEIAMGLAILESFNKHNITNLRQIALWDKQETKGIAGTYPDMLRWKSLDIQISSTTNYISTQQPVEANTFTSNNSIEPQPLDLVIYTKNDKGNITINSIEQLQDFFDSSNLSEGMCIDFNRQVFGTAKSTENGKISQRAMGQLVFNYTANNQLSSTDSFITKLANLTLDKITAMDTETFCLEDDLRQLSNVIKVDATEAIVFYTGRILEATSNYCVKRFGEGPPSNVFSNIEYINDYNLLDHTTRYWAHALRRLSNQYRHMLKSTNKIDGQIAVVLLNTWLDWLINNSPLLKTENQFISLTIQNQSELSQQFSLMTQWMDHKNIVEFSDEEIESLLVQPVFASVIIEELINKKEMPNALKSLTKALASNPDDLRLNQLKGLFLSRVDELEEAEDTLMKLRKQAPNDDETLGILAGVIKKIWQNGDTACFSRWGKLYLKGWKLSKHKNTYLGINAASYCLWNNRIKQSQEIATHIIGAYNHRKTVLQEVFEYQITDMDYWDQATLAEAHLLAGNTQLAQENYQLLLGSESNLDMPHEIAATQLKRHLTYDSITTSICLEMMVDEYAW